MSIASSFLCRNPRNDPELQYLRSLAASTYFRFKTMQALNEKSKDLWIQMHPLITK